MQYISKQSEAYIDNSLRPVGRDLSKNSAFTLSAIMHNEMYFLPAFLEHYRKLGVERFIFIDDNSTDGSGEFALAQPDVMVLKSAYRYNDTAAITKGMRHKMMLCWRQSLLSRYANGVWSLHVDLDEFLDLPAQTDFKTFLKPFPETGAHAIWSAMIDLYPKHWRDLEEGKSIEAIDWFFDARSHLRPAKNRRPTMVYSGSRARLMYEHEIWKPKEKFVAKMKRLRNRNPYPIFNSIRKPALILWREGMRFASSHIIEGKNDIATILPLRHYKYTPALSEKIEYALKSNAYFDGSREYKLMQALKSKMQASGASFFGNDTKPYQGFKSFEDAGIYVAPKRL